MSDTSTGGRYEPLYASFLAGLIVGASTGAFIVVFVAWIWVSGLLSEGQYGVCVWPSPDNIGDISQLRQEPHPASLQGSN